MLSLSPISLLLFPFFLKKFSSLSTCKSLSKFSQKFSFRFYCFVWLKEKKNKLKKKNLWKVPFEKIAEKAEKGYWFNVPLPSSVLGIVVTTLDNDPSKHSNTIRKQQIWDVLSPWGRLECFSAPKLSQEFQKDVERAKKLFLEFAELEYEHAQESLRRVFWVNQPETCKLREEGMKTGCRHPLHDLFFEPTIMNKEEIMEHCFQHQN